MQQDQFMKYNTIMTIRILLVASFCAQLSLTADMTHWTTNKFKKEVRMYKDRQKYQMLLHEFSFYDPYIVKQANIDDGKLMKTFLDSNEFVNIGRHIHNIQVKHKQDAKQNALIFIEANDNLENTTKKLQILAKGLIPMILVLQDHQFERLYNKMKAEIDKEVYFFKASTEEIFEAYVINGKHVQRKLGIIKSDTFIWENGINKDFIKRRSDFNGLVLTAMTEFYSKNMNADPSYIQNAKYFKTNDTYLVNGFTFGFIHDLIFELQSRLNFSVLLYKHRIEQWGFVDLLPNGTLHGHGIVGDVFYKHVDMAVAPLSLIYRRALYIDYLPPVLPDFVGIFIPTVDEMINMNTFHLPYSPRMWMVIFMTAFVFTIFKIILLHNHHYVRIIDGVCFLWTSCIAFFGGKPTGTKIDSKQSYRLTIFFSLLSGFIVWSNYKAQLKATLTVVRKAYPFQDLESFSRTDWL